MSTTPTSGDDLLPDDVAAVRTDDQTALVRIDDVNITLGGQDHCDHVFWVDEGTPAESRLFALEPDPESGMWTCCPNCGLILGQNNLGSVPRELL